MYSINVSFYAENVEQMAINFASHLMAMGHSCLATTYGEIREGEKDGVVEMLFATKTPTVLFKLFEEYACESTPVPDDLRDIYFHEMIYSLHTVPKDVDFQQLTTLINHNINFACILRRDNYRLRNMGLAEDVQSVPDSHTVAALLDAINILSKKVLGTELLTTINKKEEVKWPIH